MDLWNIKILVYSLAIRWIIKPCEEYSPIFLLWRIGCDCCEEIFSWTLYVWSMPHYSQWRSGQRCINREKTFLLQIRFSQKESKSLPKFTSENLKNIRLKNGSLVSHFWHPKWPHSPRGPYECPKYPSCTAPILQPYFFHISCVNL